MRCLLARTCPWTPLKVHPKAFSKCDTEADAVSDHAPQKVSLAGKTLSETHGRQRRMSREMLRRVGRRRDGKIYSPAEGKDQGGQDNVSKADHAEVAACS